MKAGFVGEMARKNGVLLVRPPSKWFEKFKSVSVPIPPVNLFYLAAFLEKEGFSATVFDCETSSDWKKELSAELRKSPVLVGVTCSTISLEGAKNVVSLARKFGAPSIAGGSHPTAFPKESLKTLGCDGVVVGEGELAFLGAVRKSAKGKRDFSGIPGILSKGRSKFKAGKLSNDLDSFGFPDRMSPAFRKYDGAFPAGITEKTAYAIFSRGCPYSCEFCSAPGVLGHKWRARSVKSALDEIENCVKAGYRHIQIEDDIFGLSSKWLFEFSKGISRRKLAGKITFTCNRRADLLDSRIIGLLAKAGCSKICIGLESGSGRILALMKKKLPKERVIGAFKDARKAGMMTQAYVIVGYPTETKVEIRETEKLLLACDPDLANIASFVPMPGSPIYSNLVSEGGAYSDGRKVNFSTMGFYLSDPSAYSNGVLSAGEIAEERDRLYRRFYLRPSYVFRRLARLRTFGDLAYSLRAGFAILFGK